MIKPIFCVTSGLLPEARLYSEAPTQLAGVAVPPSDSPRASQCSAGMCGEQETIAPLLPQRGAADTSLSELLGRAFFFL